MTENANIKNHVLMVVATETEDSPDTSTGQSFPGGEKNTASNLTEFGLFQSKQGVDLQFRGLNTETPSSIELKYSDDDGTLFINYIGSGGVPSGLQVEYEAHNVIQTKTVAGALYLQAEEQEVELTAVDSNVRLQGGGVGADIVIGGGSGGNGVIIQGEGAGVQIYGDNNGLEVTGMVLSDLNFTTPIAMTDGTATELSTTADSVIEAINELAEVPAVSLQRAYDNGPTIDVGGGILEIGNGTEGLNIFGVPGTPGLSYLFAGGSRFLVTGVDEAVITTTDDIILEAGGSLLFQDSEYGSPIPLNDNGAVPNFNSFVEGINFATIGGATTYETTGWETIFSYDLAVDDSTRTLTVSPPTFPVTLPYYSHWNKGVEYTKMAAESIVLPDTEGMYLVYYDDGVLDYLLDPNDDTIASLIRNHTTVAYAYWDAENQTFQYVGRESHTRQMSQAVHSYLHFVFGAQYISGLDLVDFGVGGDGNSDADAQFGITSGVNVDEDVAHFPRSFTALEGLPVFYLEGSEANPNLRSNGLAGFSVTNAAPGERLAYNHLNQETGEWELLEVTSGDFVLCHVFTNNSAFADRRTYAVVGQGDYATLTAARTGAEVEIRNLVSAGTVGPEQVALYTAIFQTRNSYSNGAKARLVEAADGPFIDWRQTALGGSAGSAGVSQNLADLNDVSILSPMNGQVIEWDTSVNLWVNKDVNARELQGTPLTDDAPADGDVIRYSSTSGEFELTPENYDARSIWTRPIDELTATEDNVPGANIVNDWNMEESGTTEWSGTSSGVVAKDTTEKAYGAQSLKTSGLSGDARVGAQNSAVLEDGVYYQVSFFAKGDGNTDYIQVEGGAYFVSDEFQLTEDWQYITFQAMRSVGGPLQILGYLTAADQNYEFWIDQLTFRPLETVANTDKKLDVIVRENGLLQSSNLNLTWTGPQTVAGNKDEIIGTDASTTHPKVQMVTRGAGTHTVYATVRAGAQPFFRLAVNGTAFRYVYFNPATCGIGNVSDVDTYACIPQGNGWSRILIQLNDTLAGDIDEIALYPAPSGTSPIYEGDEATVDGYAKEIGVRSGTIEENIGHIETTTAAYPRTQRVEVRADPALKHAAGYLLTADGAWVPVSEVNGLMMDESPAAVAFMRQKGLYKAVESGAWGPLTAGITYWANDGSGYYYELFEGVSIDDCPAMIEVSLPQPEPPVETVIYQPSVHMSDGHVWKESIENGNQAGAIPVPTFVWPPTLTDGKFAGFSTSAAGLELAYNISGVNGWSGNAAYRIEVKWSW